MDIDLGLLQREDALLDQDFTFDDSYVNKNIKALNNLHVKGRVFYNAIDNLEISLYLTGDMILTDSVTLEDITYPLALNINEEYELNQNFLQEYTKSSENVLDILKILWENIVLEVPISLTKTNDARMSGDGWSLGKDKENQEIDPRLADLSNLWEKIGKE